MQVGSKEFDDLIKNFESNRDYLPYAGSFEKEDRRMWNKGQIYQDGNVNNFFKCFALGYSFGRVQYL